MRYAVFCTDQIYFQIGQATALPHRRRACSGGGSMSCTVKDRKCVRRAAKALRDTAPTVAVDVVAPGASQYDQWTLDAVLRDVKGIPPEVLPELALAGLTLRPTPSQGEFEHITCIVLR